MTPADRALLADITTAMQTAAPRIAIDMIKAYWRDDDRPGRTPREWLVLHLGFVIGVVDELLPPVKEA